jgi:branched-chain amino acid transport system permease protein
MDFTVYAVTAAAIMTVLLVGQQLLLFDTGIFSLGGAAFFACGAYLSAVLSKNAGYPSFAAMLIAALAVTSIALLVGVLWLRTLRSDFFALATLALSLATVVVLRTVGPGGLTGMAGVPSFGTIVPPDVVPAPVQTMLLCLAVAILSIIAVQALRGQRIGAIAAAVRVDENVAATLGFRPLLVKLQIFLFSSFLAALAGAMQAHLLGVVEPRMASIDMTVLLLVGTILSGGKRAWGCAFGAMVVVLVPEVLQRVFVARAEPQWRAFLACQAAYGGVIIVMIFCGPWLQRFTGMRLRRA